MSQKEQAATLIEAIADSIERHPDQFHYDVNVIGMSVAPSGPGSTGVVIAPVGGGPGSSVTGLQITAGGGQAEVHVANKAISAHRAQVVEDVRAIATELRGESPSTRTLTERLAALGKHLAPPVIVELILTAITGVAGIRLA